MERIKSKIILISFIVFLTVLWQIIVDKGVIERYKLPSPTDILKTLIKILPDIKIHIYTTLYEALLVAIIQHNTSGFASPVEKGIKTPKDFEEKKYGGWGLPME